MMKKFILAVVGGMFFSALNVLQAQQENFTVPEFDWVATAAGKLHDKVRCICTDPQGNIFLTGEFTGTTTFGTHVLESTGGMDFFVAKVDPNGKFLWVKSGGGDKIDRGYGVCADQQGNCYVTGHYQSAEATFDGRKISNQGDYDIFIAKYDPTGKLLWLKHGGGKGYDYGHGIAVNDSGNVFVTGAIVGEGLMDGVTIGSDGPAHVFCTMLNTDGKIIWNQVASGKGSSSGHGVAVDKQGKCYVGGHTGGAGTFAGKTLANVSGRDVLIACLDSRGKLEWLHEGRGSGPMIHEIACDSKGNVWASGMFKGEWKLPEKTVPSAGDSDILLMHLDARGNLKWTKSAGGKGIDYGLGIVADEEGNSYLCGSFQATMLFEGAEKTSTGGGDIYVASFDTKGALKWFTQVQGKSTDHAYTIARDSSGNLFFSGACSGPATFGKHTIPNQGSNDIYLTKIKAPIKK